MTGIKHLQVSISGEYNPTPVFFVILVY